MLTLRPVVTIVVHPPPPPPDSSVPPVSPVSFSLFCKTTFSLNISLYLFDLNDILRLVLFSPKLISRIPFEYVATLISHVAYTLMLRKIQ